MTNAADWAEICQLKSAYGWHYDTPHFEALVDLFTDDAVCVFGAYGTWTGKDEIRAGFAENVGAPDNPFPSLHTFANPMIAIDGDEATGKWYLRNSDVGRIRPGQERKLDWHADAAAGVSE